MANTVIQDIEKSNCEQDHPKMPDLDFAPADFGLRKRL